MRRQKQNKGNPLVGCLLIILFGVIFYWAVWLAPNERRQSMSSVTVAPYPTVEFVWTRGAYDFERATTEGRVDLRICPELRCDVVTSVGAGASLKIRSLVLGDDVRGEIGWFEVERDNQLLYAPVADVFADTVERMALTESASDGRFELTPTLLPVVMDSPLCDEPKTDCRVLANLTVGDVVVALAFVDGDGGAWMQVNFNNVIGYVVLDAIDQYGGGE